MRLKEDIRSCFKNRGIYGKKGEEVTVITDRHNVCIVEDKSGNRYAVNKNLLTEDHVNEKPTNQIEEKIIINQAPAKQFKKRKPAPSNDLFKHE